MSGAPKGSPRAHSEQRIRGPEQVETLKPIGSAGTKDHGSGYRPDSDDERPGTP
jgi:hypothetical protein